MKKTINVNVGGYAFSVEEDAYNALNEYIDSIRDVSARDTGGEDVVSDIEGRIGELLKEKKGGCEVISLDMVSAVKGQIGQPSDIEAGGDTGAYGPEEGNTRVLKKKLYRDIDYRKLGGVCSGLGAYFNTDAVWFRLGWSALFFGGLIFGGRLGDNEALVALAAMLAYIIMWISIPAAQTVEQKCRLRGEPVNLQQFRSSEGGRNFRDRTGGRKTTVQSPAPYRRPLLARIILVGLGIIFLMCGSGCIGGSITLPFINTSIASGLNNTTIIVNGQDICMDYVDRVYDGLLLNSVFWWVMAFHILALGLLLCYYGICLVFEQKTGESWHFGLILLILWAVSLIALIAFSSIQIFGPGGLTL